jgi:hypothetical protein
MDPNSSLHRILNMSLSLGPFFPPLIHATSLPPPPQAILNWGGGGGSAMDPNFN